MEMSDWQDILTGVLLFVACMVFSLVAVNILSPIVLFVAFFVLTYFFLSLAVKVAGKEETGLVALLESNPVTALILGIISMVVSAVIVLTLADIVKLVAAIVLAWIIFRLSLKYVSEKLSRELDEFFH